MPGIYEWSQQVFLLDSLITRSPRFGQQVVRVSWSTSTEVVFSFTVLVIELSEVNNRPLAWKTDGHQPGHSKTAESAFPKAVDSAERVIYG